MADDSRGERTEAPTPRRRQEARERGNVVRSVDLGSAFFLLGAFLLLYFMGSRILTALGAYEEKILMDIDRPPLDVSSTVRLAVDMVQASGGVILPFLIALMVLGVAVNILQTGFVFSGRSLTPDLGRLNPLTGFGRLFSAQSGMRLVMSLLKIVVIGVVMFWIVRREVEGMMPLATLDAWGILGAISSAIFFTAMKMALLLVGLAVLDYLFQRWQHEKELRMTKQEVRDELRRYEGDPQIRQRRLQLARQLARQRMMKAVEKADVVITNPTELAIALHYDPANMSAPRVVAKGARLMALRIRQVASEHQIPIVERKPLAQALFAACKVGDVIPEQLYKAVAEVLSFIYGLDPARGQKFAQAGAAR